MAEQSTAGHTAGQILYERANDARRNGDHETYTILIGELIAYNAAIAAAKGGAS